MTSLRTLQIDLAPHNKHGLVVHNPILLGAGSVGLGDAQHAELELKAVGAVVVGPLTHTAQAGSPMPRSANLPGGMVLDAGGQNRGLEATLRHVGGLWSRLGPPVVVQVAESGQNLGRLAQRLSGVEGVAGFELLLRTDTAGEVKALCERLARATELPFWAHLADTDLDTLCHCAEAAVEGGASALVVAQPPLVSGVMADGALHTGRQLGPTVAALTLARILRLREMQRKVPLIAAGGFFTEAQVRAALAAGALAVQLDAVAWIEPSLPGAWARLFAAEVAAAHS